MISQKNVKYKETQNIPKLQTGLYLGGVGLVGLARI